MRTTQTILKYVLAALIVLILGGLTGWYFFVRSHTSSTAAISTARGLESEPPTFTGSLGSTAANIEGSGISPSTSTSVGAALVKRLWEVDRVPVAGMGFAPNASTFATSTNLYFAERASGYIFEADTSTRNVVRLTNTLMPKTYEAVFVPGKYGVLLRSLDKSGAITTFAGTFQTPTSTPPSPQTLSGYYLAKNILAVAADPKSGALFYLTRAFASSGVVGTTLQWDGSKQKQVFASPITSWRPSLANGQTILLESPADDVPGYAYTIGKTGALVPLLGPVPGLIVLPHPSENALLYSTSQGGALGLYVRIGKKTAALLPTRTITEKCVWAPGKSLIAYCAVPTATPSSHFLNDWYQGVMHTADTWWQVDTAAGTAQIMYAPSQALDVQNPSIDASGNYIAFVNGPDQSLWVLRVAQ